MEINRDRLCRELKQLRNYYMGNPKKDMIRIDYPKFVILNNVFCDLTGFKFPEENIFDNPEEISRMLNKDVVKACYRYCGILDEYLEIFFELFENYCKKLDDVEYCDAPFFSKLRKYSEKDFIDILLSYYATYGDKYYRLAKKYVDEGRIMMGYKTKEYTGMYVGTMHTGSGYIFNNDNRFNSLTMNTLAHELGHAVDREMFVFPQKKRMTYYDDVFLEVPSAFFEFNFINYLKKERIDQDGADILTNDLLLKISEAYGSIFSVLVDESDEKFNDIDLEGNVVLSSGTKIEFRDTLLYGLGYYTALHMHALCAGDYKNYMKEFYNFISSRKEAGIEGSIENLGISFEDYLSSEIIAPTIEENAMALKKKYNL